MFKMSKQLGLNVLDVKGCCTMWDRMVVNREGKANGVRRPFRPNTAVFHDGPHTLGCGQKGMKKMKRKGEKKAPCKIT